MEQVKDYKYVLDESSIVAITDHKGVITYVNENFCNISKYSAEELLGKPHFIINSAYHSKQFIDQIWSTITNGKVWKGELKNNAKDGTIYWVSTTIIPFLNNLGKPYKYVSIRSDITEKKKVEEQILESKQKVSIQEQILNAKNQQLIDFCNVVSHNLRSPLTNISMLIDYIEKSNDVEEQMEILIKIKPVVNQLMEVFNELVESIQVKDYIGIESENISLINYIDKVLATFSTEIKTTNTEVQINLGNITSIYYPTKYFEDILTNLISNALKFQSPLRKLKITIKAQKLLNNVILFTVADNGLGLDVKLHKGHLFKIQKTFHKHPDAKGFGLYMLKSQIEAMGGEIWLESEPNIGSTFYIAFKNQNI
jgi:PAS domain S-box-containing protein